MNTSRPLHTALLGAFLSSALSVTALAQSPPPIEDPFGTFIFETPEVPEVAPYPITEMAYLEGSYVDSSASYLGVTIDLAMDESGKVLAMGVLPGFRDKQDVKAGTTQPSENVRTLYVRTINGEPVLTANATAAGEYDEDGVPTTDDSTAKGSGQADIYLGSFPPFQDPSLEVVPVMSSFKGKLESDKDKEKPAMSFLYLDPVQVRNLTSKDWEMLLSISPRLDSRSKPFYVASLSLIKPDGTEIRFPERRIKNYSDRLGYSFQFSSGTVFRASQPVLDTRGKPLKDKTTTVKFSNLLFQKDPSSESPSYFPASGVIDYQFFGQKGFGHAFNFEVDQSTPIPL
jgi:hypothetical protein